MLLEIGRLRKSFGSLKVADDIDLSVRAGETVGIIGPNGAGKTTLFGLIAGSIPSSGGSIRLDGVDITRLPPHLRCRAGIARSHQIPKPFAKLTVFENCLVAASFGRRHAGAPTADFVAGILDRTGLLPQADRIAGTLTLLERKRLEMARALATSPRILLLDEIAGGLTERECQALVSTIARLRATGLTILWIEHIMHALTAIAERLVVLNFGRKIADGPTAAVMNSPEVREIYLGIEA
jgi:branched-chain amino acid transport system ATP-binding protein